MKKLFLILVAIVGFITTTEAQNIIVQQSNNQNAGHVIDPNVYYINGIPSTLDVGGVEAQRVRVDKKEHVRFQNYHSVPVTVVYHVNYRDHYNGSEYESTGSVVLKANESRMVYISGERYQIYGIATITRKL